MLRRNKRYKGFLIQLPPPPVGFDSVSVYFISFRYILFRFVSFLFGFALYRYPCILLVHNIIVLKLIFILLNCTLRRHLKITVTSYCLFATNEFKFSVYNQVIRNTRIRCYMISCSKCFYLSAFSSLGSFRVFYFFPLKLHLILWFDDQYDNVLLL